MPSIGDIEGNEQTDNLRYKAFAYSSLSCHRKRKDNPDGILRQDRPLGMRKDG
jgi:hypothetical protein